MFITPPWSTDPGTLINPNDAMDGGYLVDGGRVTSIMDGGH